MPKISVVMPAYNAERTLAESLASLASQSFRDFEVVLVDDGSTDRTVEIGHDFSAMLAMKILVNTENYGVAASLNRGLAESDSLLVARLDADDIAHPSRLAVQMSFLMENPAVDVCGSDMPMFETTETGAFSIHKQPQSDAAIKTTFLLRNAMSHPSILLRRSFFKDVGIYDSTFDFAEDYDLWCRGALLGKVFANLEAHLTSYRVHSGQVGQTKRDLQMERDMGVRRRYIAGLVGDIPPAYLPELFSPHIRFTSREIALWAVTESTAALLALGRVVQDKNIYSEIVKNSIRRNLN